MLRQTIHAASVYIGVFFVQAARMPRPHYCYKTKITNEPLGVGMDRLYNWMTNRKWASLVVKPFTSQVFVALVDTLSTANVFSSLPPHGSTLWYDLYGPLLVGNAQCRSRRLPVFIGLIHAGLCWITLTAITFAAAAPAGGVACAITGHWHAIHDVAFDIR